MFEQANCFYICSKLCKRELKKHPGREDLYSIPEIVNLAFSCELYLKSLVNFIGVAIKKEHRFTELYELLSEDIKNEIVRSWDDHNSRRKGLFKTLLKENSNAYYDWRYCHEKKEMYCDIDFVSSFADLLKEECSQRFYEKSWRECCVTLEINSDL